MRAFNKWKRKRKFKKAGQGRTLGDADSSAPVATTRAAESPRERREPPAALSPAAAAALERQERQAAAAAAQKQALKTASARLREQKARKAAAAASAGACTTATSPGPRRRSKASLEAQRAQEEEEEAARASVRYLCPLCGARLLRSRAREHVRQCAQAHLERDPSHAACAATLILTSAAEVRDPCVNTIIKYMDNILAHPGEPKYRRVRRGNKVFQKRIEPVPGAVAFFGCIGFDLVDEPVNPEEPHGETQQFFILEDGFPMEALEELRAALLDRSLRLAPSLDRDMQVLPLTGVDLEALPEIPDDFYSLSSAEVKAEAASRRDQLARQRTLQTRAMRMQSAIANGTGRVAAYRFTLVRIRIPGTNVMVQGTFGANEPTSAVYAFLADCLEDSMSVASGEDDGDDDDDDDERRQQDERERKRSAFVLSLHPERTLVADDDAQTFTEAGLVPAVVLTFALADPDNPTALGLASTLVGNQ